LRFEGSAAYCPSRRGRCFRAAGQLIAADCCDPGLLDCAAHESSEGIEKEMSLRKERFLSNTHFYQGPTRCFHRATESIESRVRTQGPEHQLIP
jgi:hypothetical protein